MTEKEDKMAMRYARNSSNRQLQARLAEGGLLRDQRGILEIERKYRGLPKVSGRRSRRGDDWLFG